MAMLRSSRRIVVPAALLLTVLGSTVFAGGFLSASAQSSSSNLSFSDDEIARANSIALADARVQNYIAGRPYSLMSHGASTNDNEPGVVRPVLLYNIDNKDQLSVTVDLQSGTVKDLLYYPDLMVKITPSSTTATGNSASTSDSSSMTITIIVVASIVAAAAVAIAAIYLKSKRKSNLDAKNTNPS